MVRFVLASGRAQTSPMGDFVIREWHLEDYPDDMAPLHVHHAGDEAFIVLDGSLVVQDDGVRYVIEAGKWHVVRAGAAHTFATAGGGGARVLSVMTPEIDALVRRLHDSDVGDIHAIWSEHRSSLI